MPFTEEQFFAVFAEWNSAIWPLQVLVYLMGATVMALAVRGSNRSTRAISLILSFMWLLNGAGYHLGFFSGINPMAWLFGAAFILEALLVAVLPLLTNEFKIAPVRDLPSVLGLLLSVYALLIYPLLGIAFGHVYPAVPVFGVAPCPTTIFTIGILLLGPWRTARWLLVIPGLWSVVGGSAAVLLGVPQDYGLILALIGLLAMVTGHVCRSALVSHKIDG